MERLAQKLHAEWYHGLSVTQLQERWELIKDGSEGQKFLRLAGLLAGYDAGSEP